MLTRLCTTSYALNSNALKNHFFSYQLFIQLQATSSLLDRNPDVPLDHGNGNPNSNPTPIPQISTSKPRKATKKPQPQTASDRNPPIPKSYIRKVSAIHIMSSLDVVITLLFSCCDGSGLQPQTFQKPTES